jgi:hypothetical protein
MADPGRRRSLTVYRPRYGGIEGLEGIAGKKKRRSGRRGAAFFFGADSRPGILGNMTNTILALAGAVGGSAGANLIPVDKRIQAAIPLLLGLILGSGTVAARVGALRPVGLGMAVAGGLSLVRQMAGTSIPLLAGETMGVPMTRPPAPMGLPAPNGFKGDVPLPGDLVYMTPADVR